MNERGEERSATSGGQRPKNLQRRSIASKVSYKEESNSEGESGEEGLSEDEFQATSEEEDSADSESGAKERRGKRMRKPNLTKRKNTVAPERRGGGREESVKQEEDDNGEGGMSNGMKQRRQRRDRTDEWLEVYLEKRSSWVCVDVEHGVAVPHLCSRNATAPLTYVVSVDGDGFVKDLGRKYDPTWMTLSRKRRVDEEWWQETLEPFLGPEDERDIQEEKEVRGI